MAIEYMTQAGYDKLKKDLADALAQRPVISAAIAEAREKGDLSENAEYDAARDAQGLLEVKIARLKEKVANARVIDESKLSADTVQLLSKVEVENLANKMKMKFQIVGESEADFSKGLLSASTPIGKALMGHSKGETVEANGSRRARSLPTSARRTRTSTLSSTLRRWPRATPSSSPRTWRTTTCSTWTRRPMKA